MSKIEYIYTAIKDIGVVVTGKTPATEKAEFYNGKYMFVTPTELHGGYEVTDSVKTITQEGLNSIKTNSIEGTSVLVGCIGWDMGNVSMCFENCATNQQINSITKIKEVYNPFYVYYWLSNKKDYLFSIASVTRTPILSKGTFEDVIIPIPKKSIQDSVTELLLTVDKKIALNKRINAELEAMAKTIYDYWFVQFDFLDENSKPYRTSGGVMEWNEQLKREIPKGWSVQRLESCLFKVSTGLNPRDNFKLGNGAIKYITVKNLRTDGTIDFSNCDIVDAAAQKIIHERSDISIGDILFASIAPLGRCYLILDTPKDWDINESVFSIRPNYSNVTSEYIYMYFMSDSFISRASSSSTGSIFKGIRIGTLLDMPIIVPPKSVVKAFSQSVSKLIHLKHKKNMESDELTRLRDWLLPMLMNGQATVSDEENSASNSNIIEMPKNDDERFSLWLQNQGIAARGDLDKNTLREIFDAMDDNDK